MIEYRVKPVTRYVITRFEGSAEGCSCTQRGEYDNAEVAQQVAYALCKLEHDQSGEPIDSMEFIYPRFDCDASAVPAVPVP